MKSKHLILRFAATAIVGGFLAAPAANAAATFVIVNANAAGVGFNDTTPVAPVGGNTGTTLGEQRLIAFQAAMAKWGGTLDSTVPIRMLATFEPLTCTATSAVLGSAGATRIYAGLDPPANPNAIYSKALTNKIEGVDVEPQFADLRARFNINLGTPGCLTGVPFYLGLDGNHGTQVDLVTVLTHEMGHGLGFQTFTDGTTGAEVVAGLPSIWDYFLYDDTIGLNWASMTNAQRAASALRSGHLVWIGGNVTAAAPGVLKPGVPLVRISGPAAGAATGSYPIGTASFGPLLNGVGVTGQVMPLSTRGSAAGDGCNPFSAIDALAARGNIVIIDRGTCGFAVKTKNAQNAGALGVIIHNNAPGPAPGLGGSDPTVTIPAVSVSILDGDTIRASLNRRSRNSSGVVGKVLLDLSQLAGASANGYVQMYAPNPYQPGSSVSHYDTVAFPNLLMEPAINGDLTHEVTPPNDLTFPLLQDIGW